MADDSKNMHIFYLRLMLMLIILAYRTTWLLGDLSIVWSSPVGEKLCRWGCRQQKSDQKISNKLFGGFSIAGGKALADDMSQCTIHRALSNVKREEGDSFLSFSAAQEKTFFYCRGKPGRASSFASSSTVGCNQWNLFYLQQELFTLLCSPVALQLV